MLGFWKVGRLLSSSALMVGWTWGGHRGTGVLGGKGAIVNFSLDGRGAIVIHRS